MATAAEQWVERGKELGKQEGIVIGERNGLRQGLLTGIELGLELKFGAAGLQLLPAIQQIQRVDLLRTLSEGIKAAKNLVELRELYEALTAEAQA